MKKTLIKSLIALLPLSRVYLFNIVNAYRYDSDFGRDIVDILHITKGDLTLIGPKLSFGGIHTGPYYYYLFAPFLRLGNYQPEALLVANAVLFFITSVTACLWLYRVEKFSLIRSILSIYFIGLTPFFIFSARGPGNAFSYLPLMLLLLISFPWLLRQKKLIYWLIYGFLIGIIINTHLVASIVFTAIFLIAFRFSLIKRYLVILSGIIISYAPIFLFELRHDFVIFKNTFIQKSYLAFTQNSNLPNPLQSSTNPFENFNLLLGHFTTWSGISFAVILILLAILALKQKSTSPLVFGSVLSLIILTIVARSQLAIHYFFPFILAIQVALLYLVKSPAIVAALIMATACYFPTYLYTDSPRKIDAYRNFVTDLDQSALAKQINHHDFNLFVARETPLAVLGWEYRYFLELNDYVAKGPSEYNQSGQLLLIDETGATDPNSLESWELSEFGPKSLQNQEIISGKKIYLFTKNSL